MDEYESELQNKDISYKKSMHPNVHSSTIHNSQVLETT